MNSEQIWLLVWDSDYGDESEGHVYVAWFETQAEAEFASREWKRPTGYSPRGGYSIYPIRKGEADAGVPV